MTILNHQDRTLPPTVPPGWKQMSSGKGVDLGAPSPAVIDFDDIALALSLTCRFAGATRDLRTFYSVAQHCVLVSHLVPDEFAAYGLLHDCHEAYLQDDITPKKRLLEAAHPEAAEFINKLKHKWDKAIWTAAGLFYPSEAAVKAVKEADAIALAIERSQLLAEPADNTTALAWSRLPQAWPNIEITPLLPEEAHPHFLARLAKLLWTSPKAGHA